jgi:hypothetical protein
MYAEPRFSGTSPFGIGERDHEDDEAIAVRARPTALSPVPGRTTVASRRFDPDLRLRLPRAEGESGATIIGVS